MPKSPRERRKMIGFRDSFAGTGLDKRITVTAAKAVALNAVDTAEALQMLDMLGLIQIQPGNEPGAGDNRRRLEKSAARKAEWRRLREEQRANAPQQKRLDSIDATPDEYGE